MKKDFGRSLADIRQVLTREPRHFGALAGLGMIMQELGDDKRALDVYRRVIEVNPHIAAHSRPGEVADREGRGRDPSLGLRRAGAQRRDPVIHRMRGRLSAGSVRWRRRDRISAPASAPTNAMRSMLVAPGVPSGTPATMMTRRPALAKPSANAMRLARSTMSSWSCASSATTQCTPQTSDNRRPVAIFGEIATIGGVRPLARHAQAGRAGKGPADDRRQIERFGDLRAPPAMASAPVASGSARCAWMMRAVGRIVLHLLGDAVHGGDRFDRVLSGTPIPPTA